MKNIHITLSLIAALLFSGSCSDKYLETSPTTSYDETFIFTTTTKGLAAINGMHKAMIAQYESRQNLSGYTSIMLYMDALGEDLVFPTAGNGWWINEHKWLIHHNVNATTLYFCYRFFYKLISNANMILEQVDGATGSEGEKKMIKGQALAYRALCHFWLVQLFAERYDKDKPNNGLGIVIRTESGSGKQARETVAKAYEQILEDLDESIRLLSDPKNTYTPEHKSNFRPSVVKGLRARVALTMQDWENAKKYAQEAIDEFTKGKLMDKEQYNAGFNAITNPEWMWGFEQIDSQTLYFYGFMAYMSYNFNSSNIRSCPKCINKVLYDKISATDIRKELWDPTGKAYTLPTKNFNKFPYMNRKFKVANYTSSVADAVYMRLSEMYLIVAEAKARLGENDAADILYTLAHQRDPQYTRSTKTGDALIEEILDQRRIELWGEGFRFIDLKRLNRPLDRRNSNHDEAIANTMYVPAGDVRWQFLIPQSEINSNEGIVEQNPQ